MARRDIFQEMSTLPQTVLDKIPHLPESPGVYLWKDADGAVLANCVDEVRPVQDVVGPSRRGGHNEFEC